MGRKIYMIFVKIFNLKKMLLYEGHGRLARWIKWRTCDVREPKVGLENELWRRWSNRRVGEWAVMLVKRRKGWRMSCDVGEVHTSQFILQPFRRFTYITAHSPTLLLLHLRHSSFSNPSFASPTSQVHHLIYLASRPWPS